VCVEGKTSLVHQKSHALSVYYPPHPLTARMVSGHSHAGHRSHRRRRTVRDSCRQM
jgi:hypothetical protein